MSEFEGLAVQGDMIAAMSELERWAEIISPIPEYKDVPSLQDPTKVKRKLIMNVKLSNGSIAEYYPNQTSARFIAARKGTTMENWIGITIYWKCLKQIVAGQEKDVLYVNKIA
jgi:hypothetical protein